MKRPAIRNLAICLVLWAMTGLSPVHVSASSIDSTPNCGVYALYTALRVEGVHVDLADLLNPSYISSKQGSTLADLQKAAQAHAVHATVLSNLTIDDLRRADCPMILHVKNEYDAPGYNHFILCVAAKNGRLFLYDAPQDVISTAGDDLAPLWDGTALALSTHPIPATAGAGELWKWGFWAAVLSLLLATVRRIKLLKRFQPSRSAFTQMSILLLLSTVFAIGQHLSPQGFHSQPNAVNAIQAATFQAPCPVVSLTQTQQLIKAGATLVDARTPTDFALGHIGPAINIYAAASRQTRAIAMADIPKNAVVVVYCQSPSCPFAPFIARRLKADGFTTVRVFQDGWEAWTKTKSPTEVATR